VITQDTVANGELNQFEKNNVPQYSFYSKDYKTRKRLNKKADKVTNEIVRYSRVHVYDKKQRNMEVNQIKYSTLNDYPYEIRLEFKLSRGNCDFLSLNNFIGNYQEVFSRFIPLLAVIYNAQIAHNIRIKGRGNKELSKVIRKSKSVGIRYTNNKKLALTEPIPEWVSKGKRAVKDQLKYMILEQKSGKQKVPQIVQEHLENMQSKDNLVDLATIK
jgi:hypothetical protein